MWDEEFLMAYGPEQIKKAEDYALSRGGKILSAIYKNRDSKFLWKCSNPNHEACNGKSLAVKYINNATKVPWECIKGHQWRAAPHTISTQNQWCPQCYAEKIKKL